MLESRSADGVVLMSRFQRMQLVSAMIESERHSHSVLVNNTISSEQIVRFKNIR